jgi:ubiquitin carboxyl-terminal hydrolase 4/11/15
VAALERVEQEKGIMKIHETTLVQHGETWHLLGALWYNKWATYVDKPITTPPPGPIDNTPLMVPSLPLQHALDSPELKRGLQETFDFELVCEQVWAKLELWYGLHGAAFPRHTINENGQIKIEVYRTRIRVRCAESAEHDAEHFVEISCDAPIGDLKVLGCTELDLLEHARDVRIYGEQHRKIHVFDDDEQRVGDAMRYMSQEYSKACKTVYFTTNAGDPQTPEQSDVDSSVTLRENSSGHSNVGISNLSNTHCGFDDTGAVGTPTKYTNDFAVPIATTYSEHRAAPAGTERGQCGLVNLGNTCFMASGLQSLSRAEPLKRFFLSGKYKSEINEDNPLGNKGKIASGYGTLVHRIFQKKSGSVEAKYSAVSPRDFKRVIGEFAPQFSGYQQHDSQELLMWLLDGLHEDLNRIRQKPVTEAPEGGSRPDDEVARAAWVVHKKRNDSIIVDLFQGQYKSTVTCPDCDRVSVTFDPFMMLSVPLPVDKTFSVVVTVVWRDGARVPTKLWVKVHGNTVGELLEIVAERTGIRRQNLTVSEVFSSKIYATYTDSDSLSSIKDSDIIVVYEVNVPRPAMPEYNWNTKATGNEEAIVTVQQRVKKAAVGYTQYVDARLVGTPLQYIETKETFTVKTLYQFVDQHVERFLSGALLAWNRDQQHGAIRPTAMHPCGQGDISSPRLESSLGDDRPLCEGSGAISDEVVEIPLVEVTTDGTEPVLSTQFAPVEWGRQPPVLAAYTLSISDKENRERKHVLSRTDSRRVTDFDETHVALEWESAFWNSYVKNDESRVCAVKGAEVVAGPADTTESEPVEPQGPIQIEHCIEKYLDTETLGEDNQWYCSKCKEHKCANKKIDLWALPEILVISLKRFSYTRFSREKIEDFVNFPIKGLDMSEYCRGSGNVPQFYDLFAVSNHFGGLGGGHYTAYAVNDDQWTDFDDSSAAPLSSEDIESKVRSSAAYVLFYRRRDNRVFIDGVDGSASEDGDEDDVEQTLEEAQVEERNNWIQGLEEGSWAVELSSGRAGRLNVKPTWVDYRRADGTASLCWADTGEDSGTIKVAALRKIERAETDAAEAAERNRGGGLRNEASDVAMRKRPRIVCPMEVGALDAAMTVDAMHVEPLPPINQPPKPGVDTSDIENIYD